MRTTAILNLIAEQEIPAGYSPMINGDTLSWVFTDVGEYTSSPCEAPNSISLPTEENIQVEMSRLQAKEDSQAYARSRKAAYDALNQLELISDDAINGTTTHADAILAIKAEFPKP